MLIGSISGEELLPYFIAVAMLIVERIDEKGFGRRFILQIGD
jgi:hypothetical protein